MARQEVKPTLKFGFQVYRQFVCEEGFQDFQPFFKTLFIKLQLRFEIFFKKSSSKLLERILNFGSFWSRDQWRHSIKNDKNIYSIKISTHIQIFVSSRLMQR